MQTFGPWQVVARLGEGGQGEVFLALRAESPGPEKQPTSVVVESSGTGGVLLRLLALLPRWRRRVGALKVRKGKSPKASARFKREVQILEKHSDPALVALLDHDKDYKWFVMPYFLGGSLDQQIQQRGSLDPLEALLSIRPIVQAVARLHNAGVVHRDIKPQNIFVDVDGRLVLGDCGIAFSEDEADRVTAAEERVGSRDWLPLWHEMGRAATVTPTTDCYALGKVIWALVLGKLRVPSYYRSDEALTITGNLGYSDRSFWVEDLVGAAVVQRESECLKDGSIFLSRLDKAIESVRRSSSPLSRPTPPCRICGLGHYDRAVDFDHGAQQNFGLAVVGQPRFRVLLCNHCGHAELFYARDGAGTMKW
jgi:serine/threonine protein kinase